MKYTDKLSDKARAKLVEVMADTPTLKKLAGTEFEITALKNGTLIKICEEAVKIKEVQMDNDDKTASLMVAMATQIPVICRIITYALLNNLHKIERNFDEVYDIILNNTSQKDIYELFLEVLKKLDVSFFFANTKSIQMLLQMMTDRRTTMEEQKVLSQEQA